MLQVHVNRLRRVLEPHRLDAEAWTVLRTVTGGYCLQAGSDEVDREAADSSVATEAGGMQS